MSEAVCVFLSPARMVTAEAWAGAIKSNGFNMSMHSDFDVHSTSGFLPCTHQGKSAGFEYRYEILKDTDIEIHGLGDPSRPARIMLTTGSSHRQLASSLVAAGVLCAMTDAVLVDPDSEKLISSADALAWARQREAGCMKDIARQEAKMSFAKLRRIAQDTLTPELARAGFSLSKTKLTYWRQKGEIYQVVLCDLNSNADRLKVYVVLWVPEATPDYNMANFPSGLPMYAYRGLEGDRLGSPSPVWRVSDFDEARATLVEMSSVLAQIAIPWFDERITRVALVENLCWGFTSPDFIDLIFGGKARS